MHCATCSAEIFLFAREAPGDSCAPLVPEPADGCVGSWLTWAGGVTAGGAIAGGAIAGGTIAGGAIAGWLMRTAGRDGVTLLCRAGWLDCRKCEEDRSLGFAGGRRVMSGAAVFAGGRSVIGVRVCAEMALGPCTAGEEGARVLRGCGRDMW